MTCEDVDMKPVFEVEEDLDTYGSSSLTRGLVSRKSRRWRRIVISRRRLERHLKRAGSSCAPSRV